MYRRFQDGRWTRLEWSAHLWEHHPGVSDAVYSTWGPGYWVRYFDGWRPDLEVDLLVHGSEPLRPLSEEVRSVPDRGWPRIFVERWFYAFDRAWPIRFYVTPQKFLHERLLPLDIPIGGAIILRIVRVTVRSRWLLEQRSLAESTYKIREVELDPFLLDYIETYELRSLFFQS